MPNPLLDQDRLTFIRNRERVRKVLVPGWPRAEKELSQMQLDVEWVRFSVRNHRTKAEQLQAEHETGRKDLFTADPLGVEAQEAQYRILSKQQGFDDLKADLKQRRQQEPAIVTAEGVLINGNRRSAALRSLYRDESHLDARYVSCLVLPEDATAAELVDLEAELQVARDFKQDYSWINEALLIQELYDREHKSFESVAARMHRKVDDVRSLHEKLQLVTQLVALSGGARLHIDFTPNESAFDELAKHIRSKPPAEAEAVRSAYFLGILTGANYRSLRHLRRADAARMVLDEIEADSALKLLVSAAAAPAADLPQSDDPLDAAVGAAAVPSDLSAILSFLAGKKLEETVDLGGFKTPAKAIMSSVQSAVEAAAAEAAAEADEKVTLTAPQNRLRSAAGELRKTVAALPKARALPGWDEAAFTNEIAAVDAALASLKDLA